MSDFRIPHNLSREEAAGMTVNERLYVAGMLTDYDKAVERKDVEAISEILRKVYLNEENIKAIIEFEFRN